MRDGWSIARLGEIVERSNELLGLKPEPEILTCTEREGLIRQSDKFSKRVASDDTSNYKVVRPFDVVFNPYLLWLGAIGQSLSEVFAITSPVYEVFRPIDGVVDPRYAGLLVCHNSMLSAYDSISIGSIPRRRRATAHRFVELEVALPPLAEQRRVVDMMRSFETLECTAHGCARGIDGVLRSVISDSMAKAVGETATFRELFKLVIGGAWGAADGERSVSVRALGTSVFRHGVVELRADDAAPRSLTEKQWSHRWIRGGDVVLERSGGGPNQPVGRVVIAAKDMPDVVPTDFMRLLRPDRDRVMPWYAFWVLWGAYQAGVPLAHQRQTTAIRNLSVRSYLDTECILPALAYQQRVCELADGLRTAVNSQRSSLESLRSVRGALQNGFLTGEHRIPESYDALFAEGASA